MVIPKYVERCRRISFKVQGCSHELDYQNVQVLKIVASVVSILYTRATLLHTGSDRLSKNLALSRWRINHCTIAV